MTDHTERMTPLQSELTKLMGERVASTAKALTGAGSTDPQAAQFIVNILLQQAVALALYGYGNPAEAKAYLVRLIEFSMPLQAARRDAMLEKQARGGKLDA